MQNNNNKTSLFVTLKKLQAKLTVVMLNIRSHSYHSAFKTNKSFNMSAMLEQQVDELALNMSKKDMSANNSDETQPLTIEDTNNTVNSIQDQTKAFEDTSGIETEFAKYLKERKHSLVTNPYIGNKLKESVWEHIHSTIRYARQGDVDTAKLHSKIAANALEESGHYLNNEDYSDLVFQIKNYFSEAQKDKE